MNPRNGCCHGAAVRIGRDPALTLRALARPRADRRREVAETFIRERFAARHGAVVRQFMPILLQLEDDAGRPQGAVGVRSATAGPLFLERYLDAPVEVEIARRTGSVIERANIVEVGNLAARGPGHARLLIVTLTELLVASGFVWVVFTGTPEVLNSFRRLRLSPLPLGEADPARMGDELADWGSYYDSRPQVVAGDIRAGHERLVRQGAYQRLGHQLFLRDMEGCDAAVA